MYSLLERTFSKRADLEFDMPEINKFNLMNKNSWIKDVCVENSKNGFKLHLRES